MSLSPLSKLAPWDHLQHAPRRSGSLEEIWSGEIYVYPSSHAWVGLLNQCEL